MRLVCPNCDAKYEVPDDAIPDTGRDVQCANCSHSWFQMRARPASAAPVAKETSEAVADVAAKSEPDVKAELDVKAEPAKAPEVEAAPEMQDTAAESAQDPTSEEPDTEEAAPEETPAEPDAKPALKVVGDADLESDTEDADDAEDDKPATAPAPAPAAYAVDSGVLAILREEAEREATARRSEASPLETQTTLGIEAAASAQKKPLAVSPVTEADAEAKPTARRDLLPDVEEINSTLRPSENASDEDATEGEAGADVREARNGFRSGFLLVMAVSILCAAVYVGAPALSRMVPALAEPLTAYVDAIDMLRLQLDGLMRSATVAINGE